MSTVPTPVSPYTDSPWCHTLTWRFALYMALERAALHNRKQQITWDKTRAQWKVEDA